MNVLILGSGGREHALAWKLSKSKKVSNLYIAPGNGGTHTCGTNIDISPTNFDAVANACLQTNTEMVIVGPEAPLVEGIVEYFQQHSELKSITIIGPGQKGAQLEGSKAFAKEFMKKFDIPTARYAAFTKDTLNEGIEFIDTLHPPYVLKADGLAAGKGVLIPETADEAKVELKEMLEGKFGKASDTVVIEEFLEGIEVSCFCYTNGKDYVMLPEAKDYKRIGLGDTGLNTGGMGSISPVSFASKAFLEKVETQIVKPTIEGLLQSQIPYHGFLFFGLMNVAGDPFVIEYNVRLGDPETESILPRIETDLMEMLEAGTNDSLSNFELTFSNQHAASVMLVSGGYPEQYEKGIPIQVPESQQGCILLHAGTSLKDGDLVTSGGRVMAVTSLRNSMNEALETAMNIAEQIIYDKKYYRKDLGFDLK